MRGVRDGWDERRNEVGLGTPPGGAVHGRLSEDSESDILVLADDGVEVDEPGNLVTVASMGLAGMELGGMVEAHADL